MKCGANETYPRAFLDELAAVHYTQPPWSTAFLEINVNATPCAPTLNTVRDNRYCFLPPPPPAPAPAPENCAVCPKTGYPYPYGSAVSGSWCCSVPYNGSCSSRKICCLTPGSNKKSPYGNDGCEGLPRCGTNPTNKTACTAPAPPPALPTFTDYTKIAKAEWQNTFENNTEFHSGCIPSA
jgi:hypothetical protein